MFRDKGGRSLRGSAKQKHEVSLKNILLKNEVEVVAQWLRNVDIASVGTEHYER
jgi:hypothetical protein